MIIIFGWEKQAEAIRTAFDNYCFNCQRTTEWVHGVESEWVTFFDIKTFRFKKDNFVVCSGCDDDFDLDKRATKKLDELHQSSNQAEKEWILGGFKTLLEEYQLSTKTEAQRAFIRSARKYAAEREVSNK